MGLVRAYTLVDLSAGLEGIEWLRIRAGINNLFDRQYFTKKLQFYPGARHVAEWRPFVPALGGPVVLALGRAKCRVRHRASSERSYSSCSGFGVSKRTTPFEPSTSIIWPSWTLSVTPSRPDTHGKPYSRAMTPPC